ncbi:MAG: EamA family transporter [Verrucomicrobia bacterium]|nr:EamA family transporter [Verrucomicrobiota bacterium]
MSALTMNFRRLLEVILLGVCWGPSFLFIKLAVEELSPFTMVAARVGIAACILLTFLKLRGTKLPPFGKIWLHFLVMGFFSASLPFVLFGFGEMRISSAMAGVINGTTPLAAALFAHFLLADERLTLSRILGVGLGLSGFLLILVPHLTFQIEGNGLGITLVAIASTSYGVGMVYGRKYLKDLPPLVGPTCQLLTSSCCLIPLALVTHPFIPNTTLSWQGVGAVLGLACIGTAAAFFLYFRILKNSGATYLAMSNYLLPIFSTILGAIFLGEQLSWTTYVALGLILTGMMIVNGTIKLSKPVKLAPIRIEVEEDRPS